MKIYIKKYKNRDNHVCQIIYGNNKIRLMKTSELQDLTTAINNWLKLKNKTELTLKIDHEYELVTDSFEESETLCDLIECGLNKKIISLPEELCVSIHDNTVIYSHRDIKPYEHYWKNTANKSELYKILSQDIIEIPYADDPEDYLSYNSQLAFHTNHGTTHGLRSAILTSFLNQYIENFANSHTKQVMNQMSDEEVACLELAGFLSRTGRTNELGWSGDLTYSPRSAAIFKHIALELGFDRILVNTIAVCFDHKFKLEEVQTFLDKEQDESLATAIIYQKLLHIAHACDLARCSGDKQELLNEIQPELETLLETSITESSEELLDFSGQLCLKTGEGIPYETFASGKQKPKKPLIVKYSNQVEETYNELQHLATLELEHLINPTKRHSLKSPSQLSCNSLDSLEGRMKAFSVVSTKYQSPTKLWFTSGRHTMERDGKTIIIGHEKVQIQNHSGETKSDYNVFEPTDGWTEEQMQTVPTDAYIEKEREYLDTHVSVCHATQKSNYALDLFCQALSSDVSRKKSWIRTSKLYQNNKDSTIFDIDKVKRQFDEHNRVDNTRYFSWHLLSCSPSLWQNTDYDSQESTVDYFFRNSSVTHHAFGSLINEILDNHHLLIDEHEKRQELIQQFNLLVDNNKYGKQGVIYQYLIPHYLVNSIAYISKTNGQPDTQNPDALHTLIQLKTPHTIVPNHDTLQVRLLVPQLLDDDISSKLTVVTHTNINPELLYEFKQAMFELANFAKKNNNEKRQHVITKPSRMDNYTPSLFQKPRPVVEDKKLQYHSPKDNEIDIFNPDWWDSFNVDDIEQESDTDEKKDKSPKKTF